MLNILKQPKKCSYLLITLATFGIGSMSPLGAMNPDDEDRLQRQQRRKEIADKHHVPYHPYTPPARSVELDDSDDDADYLTSCRKQLEEAKAKNESATRALGRAEDLLFNTVSQLASGLFHSSRHNEVTSRQHDAQVSDEITRRVLERKQTSDTTRMKH